MLLLPSVTKPAPILVFAPVGVRSNEVFDFPVGAEFPVVLIDVWLASEVLPVVGVDTALLIVVLAPRTPNRLEVKHVEVRVFRFHGVKQINGNFVFGVSECADFAVVAVMHLIWVRLAKLALVFLRMVELLDSVVGLEALFSMAKTLVVGVARLNLRTHFAGVGTQLSASVFFEIVVVKTTLWVVLMLVVAA